MRDSSTHRWMRLLVTLAVLVALLYPVAIDQDGFPLSTYPMYSSARGGSTTFVVASGIDVDGKRGPLSLDLIGRSDDPLVVAGELRAALASGDIAGRCDEIAERVGRSSRASVAFVEIASERHDTVAATKGEDSLVARDLHVRCEVR